MRAPPPLSLPSPCLVSSSYELACDRRRRRNDKRQSGYLRCIPVSILCFLTDRRTSSNELAARYAGLTSASLHCMKDGCVSHCHHQGDLCSWVATHCIHDANATHCASTHVLDLYKTRFRPGIGRSSHSTMNRSATYRMYSMLTLLAQSIATILQQSIRYIQIQYPLRRLRYRFHHTSLDPDHREIRLCSIISASRGSTIQVRLRTVRLDDYRGRYYCLSYAWGGKDRLWPIQVSQPVR